MCFFLKTNTEKKCKKLRIVLPFMPVLDWVRELCSCRFLSASIMSVLLTEGFFKGHIFPYPHKKLILLISQLINLSLLGLTVPFFLILCTQNRWPCVCGSEGLIINIIASIALSYLPTPNLKWSICPKRAIPAPYWPQPRWIGVSRALEYSVMLALSHLCTSLCSHRFNEQQRCWR